MKTLSDETLIDFSKTLGGKEARPDFAKKEEFSKLIEIKAYKKHQQEQKGKDKMK